MRGWITRYGTPAVAAIVSMMLLPTGLAASDSPDLLKEKALAEFNNARYPSAFAFLEQAREDAPDDAEVYYFL